MDKGELLRKLPKIDELLKDEIVESYVQNSMRAEVIAVLRETIDKLRNDILDGKTTSLEKEELMDIFVRNMEAKKKPKLRKVINATSADRSLTKRHSNVLKRSP